MERFRFKLIGLGIVALMGTAIAANDDFLPVHRANPVEHRTVVPAGGEPAILPASVRFASAAQPVAPAEPIWLPAARTALPPASSSPARLPDIQPRTNSVQVEPNGKQTPPAVYTAPPSHLPPGNIDSSSIPIPAVPTEPWRGAQTEQPKLPGSDTPVEPVRPMVLPTMPGTGQPRGLPAPRSVGQPNGRELPVAPPELMVPDCPPVKHGAFGSPPIRLGRDYPPLSELCGTPLRDWFASRHASDREPGSRGFIQGEYLLWWMPGLRIPVLATTNPDPNRFGFLGEPGTVSILGPDEDFIGSTRQGLRIRGGYWFDDCMSCGIDGSLFFLWRRTADASFSSSQFGIITRPIFAPNIQPGIGVVGETGEAVTVPNVLNGSLSAHAESFMWGADLNIRHCIKSGCDSKFMGFAGYRFLSLSEELSVAENILVVGTSPRVQLPDPVGTVITVRDSFETENTFNGGQIGLTYERRRGDWSFDVRGSVAFGVTHQELNIDGVQTRTRPGQLPATFRGGLLAAGPNLGTFTRDQFSVVPEFTFNVGYWLRPNLRAYVGYNFLYWPNVIRPGDQIDRVVDLTFVPNAPAVPPSGQLRPQPLFSQSDLWVTGVQFGVEWRW